MSAKKDNSTCSILQCNALKDGRGSASFNKWRMHALTCDRCRRAIDVIDSVAAGKSADGSISPERRQEMLNALYGEVDARYGTSGTFTKMIGWVWRTTAAAVVVICASWLLFPENGWSGGSSAALPDIDQNAVAATMLYEEDIVQFEDKVSEDAVELHNSVNDAFIELEELTDWDLTGW